MGIRRVVAKALPGKPANQPFAHSESATRDNEFCHSRRAPVTLRWGGEEPKLGLSVIGPLAATTYSADYEFLEMLGGQVKQLVDGGNLAHHGWGRRCQK